MTNVADATDFELSKENIQPIQQGRKAEVLKSALTIQPEDKLVQQRRLFEQELRSYSGDDPLSIWCRYIKWVEQNYPKGGREGNIGKLIQQCLLILRDENKYYNDDRFIDVWLKFAKMSLKPLEVYSNMYSHGIGCQNSRFYMAWAWENEQLGNLKRADDILLEGIKRNAQPIEALRSTHADLEMRLAQAIGAELDKVKYDGLQEPEQRSAFTMLKAQSKNKAPVSRVGDSTIATNRQNMTINQQQQQQTKNSQGKLPFKIYSGDNEANSFPTQSKKGSNPTAHSEGTKENERKPLKWSKVKVQQATTSHVREPAKTEEFIVHCDDTPQPNSVKKLPPTSQILTSRKWPVEPPVAIFEPPNPLMRPMYDKMKVYGGAEEFSFEELMAIKWTEKQKKAKDEVRRRREEQENEELKATVKRMQEEISYLKDLALQQIKKEDAKSVNLEAKPVESTLGLGNDKQDSITVASKSSALLPSLSLTISTQLENPDQLAEVRKDDLSSLQKLPNDFVGTNEQSGVNSKSAKFGNTYMANEVDCMMRELYNGTLGNNTALDTDLSFDGNMGKNDYKLDLDVLTKASPKSITSKVTEGKAKHASDFPPLSDALPSVSTETENKKSGFFIYHDPTEVLPPKLGLMPAFPIFHDDQPVNDENMRSAAHDAPHENRDTPRDSETDANAMLKINPIHNVVADVPPYDAKVDDENTENVPPAGYVQETEKRELAGILQPSKSIYYVPLEQQLQDDEIDEDIHGGCMAGVRPLDDNLTMLTPEQFAAAACFASTPCVKSQILGIRESAEKADVNFQHDAIDPPNNRETASLIQALNNAFSLANSPKVQDILKQILLDVTKREFPLSKESAHGVIETLKLCHELTKNEKLKSVLQQCASLAETMISATKDFNQTNAALHYRTLQLSTIMETSRESKSSSSSNSGIASVSKHKSVHSMHLSSVSKLTKTPIPEVIDNSELLEKDLGSSDKCQSELAVHSSRKNGNGLLGGLDIDPFDPDITSRLLKALSVPISQREDFYDCKDTPIHIKSGSIVELGNTECMIENLYAEGAYAKVFSALCLRNSFADFDNTYLTSPRLAIKVCKNANEWEFYICSELAERLHKRNIPDITNSVLKVKSAVAFQNGLVIVSDLFEQGTLLDVVNLYKSQKTRVPECLVMFFALEMLRIISGIHQCGIVHGDIKPDNFVLNNIPPTRELEAMVAQPRCLRLIDFGRAIDLTLYKPGVTFSVSVKTDAFQCTQMREGHPWVYETDWYGVLGCIHILLFSDYMDVRKNGQGQWEPTQKFKRYFQNDVWQPMFHSLLNISSPYEVPDLNPFTDLLTQKLQKQMKDFKIQVLQMGMALSNRSRPMH